MTIDEVFNYFRRNWQLMSREVGFHPNTYQRWLKKGFISINSQYRIEEYTKGRLQARFEPDLTRLTKEN